MRAISGRVRGRTIVLVRRIAKRVVMELDSGHAFVIEPRMTGLMLLTDPPSPEHLRFEWEFEPIANVSNPRVADSHASNGQSPPVCHDRLWFWDRRGLGTLRLYSADELARRLGPPHLGPDALTMTPDQWSAALARTRREIKVALLDQTLVAGIGNLYASEILHRAGIHPQAPASRLSRLRIARLQEATIGVLKTAILYEGSTLNDGTYRNALNKDGSFQNEHRVYARAGESCPSCGVSAVRRIVQAQRSTFFCPACQRRS